MDREHLVLHLIRAHDHTPAWVTRQDDESLRNTHALEHKAQQDHEHD